MEFFYIFKLLAFLLCCNYIVITLLFVCAMRAQIIKIGNSKGIRIPKTFIEQSGIENEVELEVEKGQLVIKPLYKARNDWDSAFKKMAVGEDDSLLDSDSLGSQSKWDNEEWVW